MNGYGSFRLGYARVGFGGNCDCRYGILCAPMLGVVFAGLVILSSSPYSSQLLVPGGGWSASGVLLCVRVCRPRAFGFSMGERTSVLNVYMGKLCGVCLCLGILYKTL